MAGFRDFIGKEFKRVAILMDFDDTLFTTKAMIEVTHADGTMEELSTKDFAKYQKREGDQFGYGQFKEILDPEPIEETVKLVKAAAKAGATLGIVTARGIDAKASIEETLRKFGLPRMTVHCVGAGSAKAKVTVIEDEYLAAGFDRVVFFDDNDTNVRVANKTLGPKYGSRFRAYGIEQGRIVNA